MPEQDQHHEHVEENLDQLLRQWHKTNAQRAAAGRDTLMARVREHAEAKRSVSRNGVMTVSLSAAMVILAGLIRRALINRYTPVAASLGVIVVLLAILTPHPKTGTAVAEILAPDGGRLDALDEAGNVMGPCPLAHTDVNVDISGFFSRVTVTQRYHNPYEKKIEAVYTFPLSHRSAVDRMRMTIDDRVVVGEVHERERARQIYEDARKNNRVASLLEQERPNIFTQSVANIEPKAVVIVEISYVEILESTQGAYTFDFPMVVSPRYVPGTSTASPPIVPAELTTRQGLILLGPATLAVGKEVETTRFGLLQEGKLRRLLDSAQPINFPGNLWWGRADAGRAPVWHRFEATYADGSREFGELYNDGTAQLNGRWFYTDPSAIKSVGTGFADNTNQVPDASRVTPMPVRPGKRAGHDISVAVTIDTGGAGIVDLESALHKIDFLQRRGARSDGLHSRVTIALANQHSIPNRDFVLSWRQTSDSIQEAFFAHTPEDQDGGFFTLILQPPDRVEESEIPSRELIFVMDTSGSMRNFPIEKSKEVMTRAIEAMRPTDTFNVITFAGHTEVLWTDSKPASESNRRAAREFATIQSGRGGTEMMQAIERALVQEPRVAAHPLNADELTDLPADGREVTVSVAMTSILQTMAANPAFGGFSILSDLGVEIPLRLDGCELPTLFNPQGVSLKLTGLWVTEQGRRIFVARTIGNAAAKDDARDEAPIRIVIFLTDGKIANDHAIIDAIRRNHATTRVFSFGIGNSVNRYLIDGMARAGRGESEVILLSSDADAAIERLTKRILTPVLTDIDVEFSDGVVVTDLLPGPVPGIPDLFDEKPLVIHGRYDTPGTGTLTIHGRTGSGPWSRTIDIELPEDEPEHSAIATVWARSKVDEVLAPHLQALQSNSLAPDVRSEVVGLGETFQIMTPYTSFVAVERSRMTIDGEPVLVSVPIEMPDGVSYEGIFGNSARFDDDGRVVLGRTLRTQIEDEAVLGDLLIVGGGFSRAKADKEVVPMFAAPETATVNQPDGSDSFGASYRLSERRVETSKSSRRGAMTDSRGLAIDVEINKNARDKTDQLVDRSASDVRGEKPPTSRRPADGKVATARKRELDPNLRKQQPASEPVAAKTAIPSDAPGAPAVKGQSSQTSRENTRNGRGYGRGGGSGSRPAPGPQESAADKDVTAGLQANRFANEAVDDLQAIPFSKSVLEYKFGATVPVLVETLQSGEFDEKAAVDEVVYAEDVVAAAARFHAEGRTKTAVALSEALLQVNPRYDLAVGLHAALSVDPPDRARIEEIAQTARQRATSVLESTRLQRVLDPVLLELLRHPQSLGLPAGVKFKSDDGLLVTVLLDEVNDERLAALSKTGLVIKGSSKSLRIVVGAAPIAALDDIALLKGVRRVSPTKTKPDRR